MKKLLLILLLSFGFTASSYAESVYVQYRGTVSLDNFDCEKTRSSFVNRICYQQQNNYVLVSLSGTYYQYCRVPYSTVNRWLNSPSKGSFYNSNIKGGFDCRYGGVPAAQATQYGAAKGMERMKQGIKQMLGIEYESQNTGLSDACLNGEGDLWEIICNN